MPLGHLFVQHTDEEEPLAGSQGRSGLVWTAPVRLLQGLEPLEALVSYSEETNESVRETAKQHRSAVGPLASACSRVTVQLHVLSCMGPKQLLQLKATGRPLQVPHQAVKLSNCPNINILFFSEK